MFVYHFQKSGILDIKETFQIHLTCFSIVEIKKKQWGLSKDQQFEWRNADRKSNREQSLARVKDSSENWTNICNQNLFGGLPYDESRW